MALKVQTGDPCDFRYPNRVALAAVLRAVAGAVMSSALWLFAGGTVFAVIAVAGLTIFLGYGVTAVRRARDVLTVSEDAIVVHGLRRKNLLFSELTAVRLAYYTTRKDGERGWMELVIRAGGQRLVVESEIDGFRQISEACFKRARAQGIELSSASERNFAALLDKSTPAGLEAGFGFARAGR